MIRRRWILGAVASLAFLGGVCGQALASGLSSAGGGGGFTGNVATDMPTGPNVFIVPNNPNNPFHVAQPDWMTAEGRISGWNFQDVRLDYNPVNDTLLVGMHFFGIAGDADGNGVQGVADPKFIAAGGSETPHLGGAESIAVRLDYIGTDGLQHAIVAGVPADKTSHAGPGIDGFNVARVANVNSPDLAFNFGQSLSKNTGILLFDPSAAHHDVEFTIPNFKSLPFLNLQNGVDLTKFLVSAFAGDPDATLVGKDGFVGRVPAVSAQRISVPEPTTMLAWAIVASGAAWRVRRTRESRTA
jgi:hypothetical protein